MTPLPDNSIRDLARKTARSIVDHGSIPMATLKESIKLQDKVDELLNKEIQFPEQQPFPEIPEPKEEVSIKNFPEIQKVEVSNFPSYPEQKAPIVNIEASKAPIVNVEAPVVEMNNEEVVAELKNISGILSKEEVDVIDKTEIVDEEGKIVNFKELFRELISRIGLGGGSPSIVNIPSVITTRTNPTDNTFATLLDDVSTTSVTYVGKAGIGSSQSSAVWQIMKMDESGTPTTLVITWADGDSQFNNIWSNRTSLIYN